MADPTYSDRGFAAFEPMPDRDDCPAKFIQKLRIYESSNAMGPHVWVSVSKPHYDKSDGPDDYAIDLPLAQVQEAIRQLQWFVAQHYQVKAR